MTTMTDSKAADVLAAHNEWRRGGDGPQTEPVTLGLALERAIARLREPAGVGGDWVLVPREPTPEMVHEGACARMAVSDVRHTWDRMLAAAPQPPAEAQPQGGGDVCETCDGAGHVVTYADPYDRGDVSSPEHSPCPACTAPPSGGLCVERTGDPDFPQWDAVKRLIEPAPPSAPVGAEALTEQFIAAVAADEAGEGSDPAAGLIGPAVSAWLRSLTQQPAAVDGAMVELRGLIEEIDPATRPATGEKRLIADQLRATLAKLAQGRQDMNADKQAQGGGEAFGWWMTDPGGVGRFVRGNVPECVKHYTETPGYAAKPLYAAPPSAPVGVEAIAAEIRASLGSGATVSTRRRWAVELEALAKPQGASHE